MQKNIYKFRWTHLKSTINRVIMAAVNLMCARVNKLNQNQLKANCQKIKIEINLQLNALAFV